MAILGIYVRFPGVDSNPRWIELELAKAQISKLRPFFDLNRASYTWYPPWSPWKSPCFLVNTIKKVDFLWLESNWATSHSQQKSFSLHSQARAWFWKFAQPGTLNNNFLMVVSIGWFQIFTWEMVGNHQTSIKITGWKWGSRNQLYIYQHLLKAAVWTLKDGQFGTSNIIHLYRTFWKM